jgi:heat shock protein HslJ
MAQNPQPVNLDHTRWSLIESPDIPPKASAGSFSLTFEHDSYQFSGCNLISGKFRIEEQKLVVAGPGISTRKACSGDAEKVDAAFSHLMSAGPDVDINADRLTLRAGDGGKWVFQKAPLASRNAKTKFIYVAAATKDCAGVVPMNCLQVRDSKDQPWTLHHADIVGFEHVPGIEYRLRIKEDRAEHAPADASSVVWYLDMIVEQTLIDRKAAEEYQASKPR